MSCRIVTEAEAEAAVPLQWRNAGDPPGRPGPALALSSPEVNRQLEGELEAVKAALQAAQGEAAAREQQARRAGIEEGRQSAMQQLEAPLKEALERAARQLEELAQLRPAFRREAEEDVVRLSVAIARRVLRREITADPSAIVGVVKAALDRLDARDVLKVRVHPEDVGLLENALAESASPAQMEISADTGLERGGVVVDTTRGSLDASIETQLSEIQRGFTDRIRHST